MRRIALFCALLLAAASAPAQDAHLVKDILPGESPASLSLFGVMGASAGGVYFPAGSSVSATELWRTDGTRPGTQKVRDLDVEQLGPFSGFTRVPSGLFFFATGALWKIDDGGEPRRIRAISGYPSPDPVAVGDRIVFIVSDAVHGAEPWGSDGTFEGTGILQDIEPGAAGSYPSGLRLVNGQVLFTAFDSFAGSALWRSDGTPEGTRRVMSLPSTGSGEAASTGALYFFACSPGTAAPYAVWRSDGTEAGTFPLRDFVADSDGVCPSACVPYGPSDFAALDGRVIFAADDGVHGRATRSSDGTTAGTALVGPVGGNFVRAGNFLYFAASDSNLGFDLWRTDGTEAGTRLVFHGVDNGGFRSAFPFAALGNQLVFVAGGWSNVWITDDSSAGAHHLLELAPGDPYAMVSGAVPWNGALLFQAAGRLWRTDGTEQGTVLVDDFPGGASSSPAPALDAGGPLLFQVDHTGDADAPVALWRTDGTEGGTLPLRGFHAFANLIDPGSEMATFRGATYFGADDGEHGMELWRTDGTPGGTVLVRDVTDGFLGSDPTYLVALGERLVFTSIDPQRGASVWATDGTAAGTARISTTWPQAKPVALGNVLLYSTFDANQGTQLWRTDGTASGTYAVTTIHPGPGGQVLPLVRLGGRVFFAANDATTWGLWSTDGTSAGTRLVRAFSAPFGYDIVAAGGYVFFSSEGYKLWRSDGTEEGTIRIAVVPVDSIASLTPVGARVFFTASDGVHRAELWTSDGTSAGTGMVREIRPGPDGAPPSSLAAVAGRIVFSASDGEHGWEPWVSDGTPQGTRMLADIAPGLPSSGPQQFTLAGGLVYFSADDGVTGRELWAIPLEAIASSGRAPARVGRAPGATRALPPRP
jgi:ELWxxDGT repeat protein